MTLNWRRVGYVFLGGSLGTMLRIFIADLAKLNLSGQTAEYVYLFVVNLAGAFALGVMAKHPYFTRQSCRDLWAVGFAGGFTTMSAVSVLIEGDGIWWLILTMTGAAIVLYGIGFRIGRRIAKRAAA
jgi:fluoride exporter